MLATSPHLGNHGDGDSNVPDIQINENFAAKFIHFVPGKSIEDIEDHLSWYGTIIKITN